MTKIKICGITNLEDALVAVEAGADLLGFIFYEPSPRYVAPEVVKEIVATIRHTTDHALRTTDFQFVGVFVNASLSTVTHILDDCYLDAAQLHGQESPEFVNHFQGRAFKALRPQSQTEAESLIQKYQPTHHPTHQLTNQLTNQPSNQLTNQLTNHPTHPTFLLDAYHPTLYGGTGQVTDWTMAANIAWRYPIMLAGSLTPANVAEAIRAVRPWGVDVSSGVEREKGRKDHQQVRAFVRAVKNANSYVKG